jgi:hypothetical protein
VSAEGANRFFEILEVSTMPKTYKRLYPQMYDFVHLYEAYRHARHGNTAALRRSLLSAPLPRRGAP